MRVNINRDLVETLRAKGEAAGLKDLNTTIAYILGKADAPPASHSRPSGPGPAPAPAPDIQDLLNLMGD